MTNDRKNLVDNEPEVMGKLFQAYRDPILILNKDLKIKFSNQEAEALFPLLNRTDIEDVSWQSLSELQGEVDLLKESRNLIMGDYRSFQVFHKSQAKYFEISIYPLDEAYYCLSFKDISQVKILEEKIKERKSVYEDFMKAAFDNIFEYDMEKDSYTPLKVKGDLKLGDIENPRGFNSRVHPDDFEFVEKKIIKATENRTICNIKYRIMQDNGEYLWVRSISMPIMDMERNIVSWLGASNDINLEKEFELGLIKREKEYMEILDSSSLGFYIVDYIKGEVHISKTWKDQLESRGHGDKELFLKPYDLVHPDDVMRLMKSDQEALEMKRGKLDCEYRVKRINGQYIWVLQQSKVIYDAAGKPVKEYGTHMDISDRKLAELVLRESEKRANILVRELRKADELKDNFISTLGHELRNPLATMSMGIGLLDVISPGSPEDLNTRKIIKRQVEQLIRLVDDLLQTNRIITNKMEIIVEELDLNHVVKDLIEEHEAIFTREEIELVGKYYQKPIYINGDSIRIKQALGNLLSNALKFTGKEGRVEVILSKDEKDNKALVRVRDTGIGIDQDALAELFQPFVQLDNSFTRTTSGLGLGLPISKGIIELHEGSIEVFSQGKGKGSEFILTLPTRL